MVESVSPSYKSLLLSFYCYKVVVGGMERNKKKVPRLYLSRYRSSYNVLLNPEKGVVTEMLMILFFCDETLKSPGVPLNSLIFLFSGDFSECLS